MNAYIYQAELWCEDCARKEMAKLEAAGKRPLRTDTESSYDSDDWPKGPIIEGGGAADSPRHCFGCCIHLQNPLTEEGLRYLEGELADKFGEPEILQIWHDFYVPNTPWEPE